MVVDSSLARPYDFGRNRSSIFCSNQSKDEGYMTLGMAMIDDALPAGATTHCAGAIAILPTSPLRQHPVRSTRTPWIRHNRALLRGWRTATPWQVKDSLP